MADAVRDPSHLRILLSNDDGIQAPGLKVLERIARTLSSDVWIVAPEVEQSGASHSLTLRRPLRLRKLDERRFAVDGTPTDCVLLAINHVLRDRKPDLVLSGVNHGSNIGEDVTYSGTIAAAMEATLLDVPSIALSLDIGDNGDPVQWATAEQWGADVIRRAVLSGWPANVLLNVNFPACPASAVRGIKVVRHGKRKVSDDLTERVDPRGQTYFWIGQLRGEADVTADTDVAVVKGGGISVTPLHLDLTHGATLTTLKPAFAGPWDTL
ncbi:MAG: 5'/3'-nucleotidase SurE [Azospirillaceae bacterium]|nr:5'/3'-nucleotidase SurE [Azospirillaceae bacterium]